MDAAVGIQKHLESNTWKLMCGKAQLVKVLPTWPKRDGDCSRCEKTAGAQVLPRSQPGKIVQE